MLTLLCLFILTPAPSSSCVPLFRWLSIFGIINDNEAALSVSWVVNRWKNISLNVVKPPEDIASLLSHTFALFIHFYYVIKSLSEFHGELHVWYVGGVLEECEGNTEKKILNWKKNVEMSLGNLYLCLRLCSAALSSWIDDSNSLFGACWFFFLSFLFSPCIAICMRCSVWIANIYAANRQQRDWCDSFTISSPSLSSFSLQFTQKPIVRSSTDRYGFWEKSSISYRSSSLSDGSVTRPVAY